MNAAADFSLCGRTPRSCSRHADCARAQMGSANPQRQSFAWPADTGERCPIFHDFAPYRKLASMGGSIADINFASPSTDNAVQGTGVPGAAADTASAIASPAGDTSSVGLDTAEALGVTACGGPSSPQDCPERAQQLHAARLLRL